MTNFRRVTSMAKAKKGDLFSCGVCGLVVAVDECGIGMGEVICCDKIPMVKGKAAAAKAKKVAIAAAKPKAETKSVVKPAAAKAKAAVKSVVKAAVKAVKPEKKAAAVKPAAKAATKKPAAKAKK
jgi:hypothetical protein